LVIGEVFPMGHLQRVFHYILLKMAKEEFLRVLFMRSIKMFFAFSSKLKTTSYASRKLSVLEFFSSEKFLRNLKGFF